MSGQQIKFNSENFNCVLPKILDYVKTLEKGDYILTIEKNKKKRSKNANAYCWALCGEIAEELSKENPTSAIDVYREAIKNIGVWRDEEISLEDVSFRCKAWEMLGIGWLTERVDFSGENEIIRFYYGSSQYNTRQMSRLLNVLVQDAEQLGIDIMSEKERSLLLEEWKA